MMRMYWSVKRLFNDFFFFFFSYITVQQFIRNFKNAVRRISVLIVDSILSVLLERAIIEKQNDFPIA